MTITHELVSYVGPVFENDLGQKVDFKEIKDHYYSLNGRIGKILLLGHTHFREQGFSGSYANFGFVYQDNLELEYLSIIGKRTTFKQVPHSTII